MPTPLVGAVLTRFLADLDQGSIAQDLLDEARWFWQKPNDAYDNARVVFCCAVCMDRFGAYLDQRECARLEQFRTARWGHANAASFRALLLKQHASLQEIIGELSVEVAEFQMGEKPRDAAQLKYDSDRREREQARRLQRMFDAALGERGDAGLAVVGDEFYSFVYRDLGDLDELMHWVRALVEVRSEQRA